MPKKKTIDDIISDECSGRCCILQEVIRHSGMGDYMLEQFKCIEKFKYEESQRTSIDIGWSDAVFKWGDKGYAKKFRQIYKEDVSFRQLYKEVMQ